MLYDRALHTRKPNIGRWSASLWSALRTKKVELFGTDMFSGCGKMVKLGFLLRFYGTIMICYESIIIV